MDDKQNSLIYVLMEEDFGGLFTSPMLPTGKAVLEYELAKEWVDEDPKHRTYETVKVVDHV